MDSMIIHYPSSLTWQVFEEKWRRAMMNISGQWREYDMQNIIDQACGKYNKRPKNAVT